MPTLTLYPTRYYQQSGSLPTVVSTSPRTVQAGVDAGANTIECGWQYTLPISMPYDFTLDTIRLNVLATAAPNDQESGFAGGELQLFWRRRYWAELYLDNTLIATRTEWDVLTGALDADFTGQYPGLVAWSFDFGDVLRSLGYGTGVSVKDVPALRLIIRQEQFYRGGFDGSGTPESGDAYSDVRNPLVTFSSPVFNVIYEEGGVWGNSSNADSIELETDFLTTVSETVARDARAELELISATTTKLKAPATWLTELSQESFVISGAVLDADTGLEISTETQITSVSRLNFGTEIGAESEVSSAYLIPLKLLAGKVTSDLGYMWIPVFLNLPARLEDDEPWEFFYPDNTPIPYLIRNRAKRQVRAMVYMRPDQFLEQDFFCRVG